METALFLFYLVAFCIAVVYIPFFKNSGIRPPFLIALFLIKIAAGFAYAKFFKLPQYYPGADTWRFYRQSLIETEWLLQKPSFFFKDLFTHGYGSAGNLFSGENSYWNDLKSNMLVKLIAITNVLTNSNYYAAIIFFNFLFLFGLVALTR
ncbi:MAG TPA: hypothetical protein VF610_08385, partial [Segetibacter sp.]